MGVAGKAVRGVAWSIGSGLGARAIGVVGTLVITRFLTPDIMGEVGAASILVMSVNQISNLGLGNYTIARHEDGPDVTFIATMLYLLAGVVALGLVLVFGGRFAQTLNAPTLAQYIPGLVLAMFIRRLGHMPDKVLARQMRFAPIGLSVALSELIYTVVSVLLAWRGWGGAAVVWGNVAQAIVMSGIVIGAVNWRTWLKPHRITLRRAKQALRFGTPVGLTGAAHYASVSWDNLLYSRYFGASQMGLYQMGYNLAAIPAVQVGDQIRIVLFPSMARVDGVAKKRALVRSIGLMGLVVFPLALGLAATADSLIAALLTKKWQGVAPVLSALAVTTIARSITWAAGSYLLAKGVTWKLASLEGIKLAAMAIGIVLFAPYGPIWACAGVGVGFTVHSAVYCIMLRADGIRLRDVWHAYSRPLWACLPMVAAVLGARQALILIGVERPTIRLAVEIVVGAAVYVPAAFLLANDIARDFVGLLRNAMRRGPAK